MASNTSQRKLQHLVLGAAVQTYANWSLQVACRPCGTTRTLALATLPPGLTIMQALMRMRCRTCHGQVEAAANQVPGWRGRVMRVWGPGNYG